MKLTTENGAEIDSPSEDDISRQVQLLNDTNNKFLILAKNELTFMQAYGSVNSNWLLEHQVGSTTEHFKVSDPTLPTSKVVSTLRQYLKGDDEWNTSLSWITEHEVSENLSRLAPDIETKSARWNSFSKLILLLSFGGIVILGIGLYLNAVNKQFAEMATPVQAEVIELIKGRESEVRPVYVFPDGEGRLYRHVYHVSSYPATNQIGDIVTLHVNFSDQGFPDRNSVRNLTISTRTSTLLIKFGVLYTLIIGLVWHVHSMGGILDIKNGGGISSIFAQRKTPVGIRLQMGVYYLSILLFGIAGYVFIEGIIGFGIGIVLSFYALALIRLSLIRN